MRIIEKRNPFDKWSIEVRCTGGNWRQNGKVPCGSLLKIEASDLIKRKWEKYPDENGVDYGFICSVCRCFTNISEKQLSTKLMNMARMYSE